MGPAWCSCCSEPGVRYALGGKPSFAARSLGSTIYRIGLAGACGRDRARGLRLLPPGADHGLGAGHEHVRDGHLGRARRGGAVVHLRDDLPQEFTALAGSGVAFWARSSAANVPLLDPSIKSLQPVLRSNFWLSTHVLCEVSSYAAFAPGLDARADRDDVLSDGDLPPLAALLRTGAAALDPGRAARCCSAALACRGLVRVCSARSGPSAMRGLLGRCAVALER